LSARRTRASRREVGTGRFYSGASVLKKKNSKNWKITRYSDKEFLSVTGPKLLVK
jgi:hypothetical protein